MTGNPNQAINILKRTLGMSLRRYHLDRFLFEQANRLPGNGLILDLGGHKTVKRGAFNIDGLDVRSIYLNLNPAKGTDVIADANHLPFRDNSFDGALCCELIEHIFDPTRVIRELFRVCIPGAVLILSTPFLARIHGDPFDFGRYTADYLFNVMNSTGFREVRVERHGGFSGVLCDLVSNWYAQRTPSTSFGNKVINRVVWSGLRWARPQTIAWDGRPTKLNEACPLGYGITAVKPSD